MKTLLLSITAISSALLLNAQINQSDYLPHPDPKKNKSSNNPNKQIAATLLCNTIYIDNSTMSLSFALDLTNTDFENLDYFSMTFPTGITPITSINNPFTANNGGGAEMLNPISGQTISWGIDNNDHFGGISSGSSYTFSVDVSIDPGITGFQTVNFLASGDGYAAIATAGDLSGTVILNPIGTIIVNAQTISSSPSGISTVQNCELGIMTITTKIKNISSVSLSDIPVKYKLDSGITISELISGPIAVGDSISYTFSTTADISSQNIHTLKSWVEMPGDISASNDSAAFTFVNSNSTSLSSANYSNGFETSYDRLSVNIAQVGSGYDFGTTSSTVHSGTIALFLYVPMSAVSGDYETHLILPCVDVITGETYRISYWRKSNNNQPSNGMSGIFTGDNQDLSSMTTVLKPFSSITPNPQTGTWEKDSIDYIALTTGTVYFSIAGKGTVSSSSRIYVLIDDIEIAKISSNISGLDESKVNVSLFPNPSEDLLNIVLSTFGSQISIIGLDGKKVFSKKMNSNSISLDTSSLNAGVYFCEILTINGNTTRTTFVKK